MMNRRLFMQMRNEWRSNLWMMAELYIVGLALWAIFIVFNGLWMIEKKPADGADFTDIYTGNIGYIPSQAETFTPYDADHSYATDVEMMLTRLRDNPYVEIVGTGSNALPYNYDFNGHLISTEIDGSTETYHGNTRYMSGETVRALRLHGVGGETPEQLAALLDDGNLLIGTVEVNYTDTDPLRWKGRQVTLSGDSSTVLNIGAVVSGMRRSDYEPASGTLYSGMGDVYPAQVVVRVRSGQGRRMMETLDDDALEYGNVYISDMQSLDDIRDVAHRSVNDVIRDTTVCALFVLMSVFLGFLGTFWFRTQQRVPEIALRKVSGATDRAVFTRFLSEGLMLLVAPLVLMVPTGVILLNVVNRLMDEDSAGGLDVSINGYPMEQAFIWVALAMCVASLALMIIAGVWLPARKAMRVNPASALKDQ